MFEVEKRLPNVYMTGELQANDTVLIRWGTNNISGYTVVDNYNIRTPDEVTNFIIEQAQNTIKDIMTNNLQ